MPKWHNDDGIMDDQHIPELSYILANYQLATCIATDF